METHDYFRCALHEGIEGKILPKRPNCDFLDATKTKKSSETWRAIRHGREVLKRGVVYRICSGAVVNIWFDNWIPTIQSMKPIVQLPGVVLSKVEDLFQGEMRDWNEVMIRQSFVKFDADEIMKIRPSRTMQEDVLAWAPEKSGWYSVRSAYRLLKTEQARQLAEKEGRGDASVDEKW